MDVISWPKKTREIQDDMMDSTRWNELHYRDGDIIIASWGKAGTTWVQQIVAQLIFDGRDVPVGELSPWLEFVRFAKDEVLGGLEAQTNRRFIKTHLPVDTLGIRPDVKYIYVARDGRDCAFSMYNFMSGFEERRALADGDVRAFFHQWLADAAVLSPFFANVQGWWDIRHLPNVLLVHYNNLKADMAAEIRRIASFLDIMPSAAAWPEILEHCSFDYMKQNAAEVGPKGARRLKGGSTSFFHKGTNGRWRDVLTAEDIAKYEDAVARNLLPGCAHWLKTGELTD
jgi:aryl sulfotransferase